MGTEHINGLMVPCTKETGKIMNSMAEVSILLKMDYGLMANFRITLCMAMENYIIKMVEYTKANT